MAITKNIRRSIADRRTSHAEGMPLPPPRDRPCTARQRDDGEYLRSADADAALLTDKRSLRLGVSAGDVVLDVGCGPGRVAIGLARSLDVGITYQGVDVNRAWVRWANKHISPLYPSYDFTHLPVKSARYNPGWVTRGGKSVGADFALPFASDSFDYICLFSVFSHMLEDDVASYLREFQRLLRPGGRVLATAFLEDGVPGNPIRDVEENPPGYKGKQWQGPLHCVRYERSYFYSMAEAAGLTVDGEDPEKKFQRHVYMSRGAPSGP